MKKNVFYYVVFLFMSLFLANSCDIDNNTIVYPQLPYGVLWQPYTANSNGQYAIGGYVNGQTRAAIDGGTYTNFSLYSWTKDSVVMDGYHGIFNGNVWGYSENLKFFDNDVDEYNFIGVIPQDVTQAFDESTSRVSVEAEGFTTDDAGAQSGVQNNTYAEDRELLYATSTVQNANYSSGANLQFKHANVKVYLKFTSDDPTTEIVDFTPTIPETPAVAATPDTETYSSKTVKFIDELTSGGIVQVGIGFVGASSPKLTKSNPTTVYLGTNNASLSYMAKDWLLSIKDAVNSQFVYYKLNAVVKSTSKTETTEDWESAASNKNIFMMKLADGVNAADFASGNDAFWKALCAHESDWVGGSPVESFKAMFETAYSQGWRVIRINASDANSNQVLVFLSSNQQVTTQVCTVVPGQPAQPAKPAIDGINDIVVLPATSVVGDGTDAVLASYPSKVAATIGLDGITMIEKENAATLTFTKPQGYISTERVASPTTWYTFPYTANSVDNVGYTIKFSYTYNGVTKYDNRVFLHKTETQWDEGNYYTYVISIKGKGNGVVDPKDADKNDPIVPKTNDIIVTSIFNDYQNGQEYEHIIK